MTLEDRIRAQLGNLMMENAAMATQMEAAQARIAELEKQLAEKAEPFKPHVVESA